MIQRLNDAMAQWSGSHFATLLSARLRPVLRDGKKLYEIPIAVTGSWVKRGRRFQITPGDLAAMVLNFGKRKNEQIVIDYEHASETPEVAQGGPIPAAGWIHHLSLVPGPSSFAEEKLNPASYATDNGQRTKDVLCAMVEWTPDAERLIQQGAYRFFSPAIDWGYHDKQTGELQGATLTSGALTNHPFLEELPPIMLTDLEGAGFLTAAGLGTRGSGLAEEPGLATPGSSDPDPGVCDQGGTKVKKLTVRKLTDGSLAGHLAAFDGDDPVGYLSADEFRDYVKQRLDGGEFDDLLEKSELSEALAERAGRMFAERVGMPGASPEAIRERLALAETVDAEGAASARALRLYDTVKDGVVNQVRAMELARDNKITLADYIAVQEAERKLDEAVREGKILPRDRQFFFRDALERPSEFADFVKGALPVVRLGSQGIGSVGDISVDEEVEIRTRNLMKDEGLSYAKALKRVLAGDKELERRYHGSHRREIGGNAGGMDGTAVI
jgi:phage I-like protein